MKQEKDKRTPPARERKSKTSLTTMSPVEQSSQVLSSRKNTQHHRKSSDERFGASEEGRSITTRVMNGLRENQRRHHLTHQTNVAEKTNKARTILQTMEEYNSRHDDNQRRYRKQQQKQQQQQRTHKLQQSNKEAVQRRMEAISESHEKKMIPTPMLKFSKSVDIEVEAFTRRLMKSQSESPDQKMKIVLPKGALQKMKRFSLENRSQGKGASGSNADAKE